MEKRKGELRWSMDLEALTNTQQELHKRVKEMVRRSYLVPLFLSHPTTNPSEDSLDSNFKEYSEPDISPLRCLPPPPKLPPSLAF